VAGQHAARHHVGDRVRQLTGERAAAGLHVAGPHARRQGGEREGGAGQLSMKRHHRDRDPLAGRSLVGPLLQRLDRVLERRVVQLYHVPLAARAAQAAGEVAVHDVEPAAAKAEVGRLDVHDHFITRFDVAGQARVGDRRA
jgi:hypothetical protein